MQFTTLFSLFALTFTYASATTMTVSYDETYDNAGQSLDTVACSDGPNGLITKGFSTFGSLPDFPNIGGAAAVAGWNSPNCGTCWELTFNGTKSITILALDTAPVGFDISLAALQNLVGERAAQDVGIVLVDATQVDQTSCEQAGSKSLPPTVHPTAHHG